MTSLKNVKKKLVTEDENGICYIVECAMEPNMFLGLAVVIGIILCLRSWLRGRRQPWQRGEPGNCQEQSAGTNAEKTSRSEGIVSRDINLKKLGDRMPTDDKNSNIVETVKDRMPSLRAFNRAVVALIPCVGGALDHLLFDKSDEIRNKNMEEVFNAISEELANINQEYICKEWFESEEALAVIKKLVDKICYDPDSEKIKSIGKITAIFGLKENFNDPLKISILDKLCDLTGSQINLLKILNLIKSRHRTIKGMGGLTVNASGIWLTDIVAYLQKNANPLLSTYIIDIEMLEAHNAVRRISLPITDPEGGGITITQIGKLAANYLIKADS